MFMGTPEIAIPSLEILYKKHDICAIVTGVDKPRGRGHCLTPTVVAQWGEAQGIDVIKPETFKDEAFLPMLEKYRPDVIIVIAYGKILPKYVLDFAPNKAINVHYSLLPKYRGAGPVQRAIINGESETGVSIMLMAEKLDAGDILHMERTTIGENETAGELFERLAVIGAKAIDFTLDNLDKIQPIKQDENEVTYAEMLTTASSFIDFSKHPLEIVNHIRGYNPNPCARMEVDGEVLKVYSARVNGDVLEILEVQPAGKKRMLYEDYLRGKRL
jgi:methionyl-tRNA formyltransferase